MRNRIAVIFGLALACKPTGECEGDTKFASGSCVASRCEAPFVQLVNGGCDAPSTTVRVPARTLMVGPSDWEAEGRVPPRTVTTAPFRIDAYEVTEARYFAWREPERRVALTRLPVTHIALAQAAQFCAGRSGRLPSEDEWMAAAMGDGQRRYPWGDTGAVCNRAAWGKAGGQCGRATHPDAVGAHTRGSTKDCIDDLAGNVAEWVTISAPATFDVAKGGSWQSPLATELRNWARDEHPRGYADGAIGFRCVYDDK